MKNIAKSLIALLLSTVLVISSCLPIFATGSDEILFYSKTANSGVRDQVCNTLDGTSVSDYYTGDYEYDDLDDLTGSSLLSALRTLMTSTHTYKSTYDDCHHKANQTDCENGDGSTVVLIYTSYKSNQDQWNGWNREHVWPKSLGGGNDNDRGGGADLHHIRPSDAVVNSTRGNMKYGNVSSGTKVYGKKPASGYLGGEYANDYYEPNDNVKGDVARICLYVYVRWGSDWGASDITSVFQSIDVLLEWCAMDPVDTWEMGRNEVIQGIQGNRNVFIDYPELAWLLFEREIPEDMTTPSGFAMGGTTCSHTNYNIINEKSASCTENGNTGDKYCNDCQKIVRKGSVIPATNHKNSELLGYVAATCKTNGYSGDRYCNDCEKIITNGKVIPATNHPKTEIKNSVKEGCATEGYTGDTYCKDCGDKIADGQSIPATNKHTYGSWELSGDDTYKRCCTVCGAEESLTVDLLIGEIGSDADTILLLLLLGANSGLIIDQLN